jgi:hypothetical protein
MATVVCVVLAFEIHSLDEHLELFWVNLPSCLIFIISLRGRPRAARKRPGMNVLPSVSFEVHRLASPQYPVCVFLTFLSVPVVIDLSRTVM